MTTSLKQIIPLSLALLVLLGYQFIGASTWTPAPPSPPSGNTEPPVHLGSAYQEKQGTLGAKGLLIEGNAALMSTGPRIEFSDTNERDWWLHANNNRMYFIADRNDDGSWSGESPWPLYIEAGAVSGNDYARFSNQVRAVEYCDAAGGNCVMSDSLGGGLNLGDTLPPPPSNTVRNNLCTSAWPYFPSLNTGELAATPGVDVSSHNNQMIVRYSYGDRGGSCMEAGCVLGHDGTDYFAISAYADDSGCGIF